MSAVRRHARGAGFIALLAALGTLGATSAAIGAHPHGAGSPRPFPAGVRARLVNPSILRRLANEPTGPCTGQTAIVRHGIGVSGGNAVATFDIAPTCENIPVGLASYSTLAPTFSLPQKLFAHVSGTFSAGGPYTLSVPLPNCFFQVDLSQGVTNPPATIATAGDLFPVAAFVDAQRSDCTSTTSTTTTESTSTTKTTTTTTTTTTTHTTTSSPGTPPTPTTTDIAVTKTASTSSASVGDEITFTVTVTNRGSGSAADVRVVDDLPSQVSAVSASPAQGTCTGTDPLTCSLGTLAPGQSVAVTIVVKAVATGDATNVAIVSTSTPETSTANNTARVTVVIGAFTPPVCNALKLSHASAVVGRVLVVVARVRDQQGNGVAGVAVTVKGAGFKGVKGTDAAGVARFRFTPRRSGVISVSIPPNQSCSAQTNGLFEIRGAFLPPRPKVTG